MASTTADLTAEMSAARQSGIGVALTEGSLGVEVWWLDWWRALTRGHQWRGWW